MPICSTVKRRKKSNAIITQLIRKAPYQLYHIKSKRKIKMKTPQFGILARLSGVYREAHIEMKDCKENLLSSESDRRKRSKKKKGASNHRHNYFHAQNRASIPPVVDTQPGQSLKDYRKGCVVLVYAAEHFVKPCIGFH